MYNYHEIEVNPDNTLVDGKEKNSEVFFNSFLMLVVNEIKSMEMDFFKQEIEKDFYKIIIYDDVSVCIYEIDCRNADPLYKEKYNSFITAMFDDKNKLDTSF